MMDWLANRVIVADNVSRLLFLHICMLFYGELNPPPSPLPPQIKIQRVQLYFVLFSFYLIYIIYNNNYITTSNKYMCIRGDFFKQIDQLYVCD